KQLPQGLERVVRKALERDPASRYATGAELLRDLRACLRPAAEERDATLLEDAAAGEKTQLLESGEGPVFPGPRRPRARLFLLLGGLVVILALAAILIRFGPRPRPAPVVAEEPQAAETVLPEEGPPVEETKDTAVSDATPAVAPPAPTAVEKTPKVVPAAGEGKAPVVPDEEKTPPPPEKAQPAAAKLNRQGFLEQVFFNDTIMVLVPQNHFTVGSPRGQGDPDEHPAHKVFISDFWLGKTEVTFDQYDAFCRDSGSPLPSDEGWGRGWRPVINVSWGDAERYCRWLAAKTGRPIRLPREAEWEKAARERFPWGRAAPAPTLVNMKGNADGYAFSAPVGSYPAGASAYGILDMAGNVWEWMADWYDAEYYRNSPERDPAGPARGDARSVRGGSWANGPDLIRAANRSSERPGRRLNVLGFRVAMDGR
ncbi:MAG: SUMF1/EgtB/PvdO family nonheme iron enzyme, partial [Candidatus Aminicenantes bacterium]|nr:SUMF1/EgtB/PvdO family nonheme iron enzyme [Candidatus Aminicenantes bacterium]